jgi:hypothetical protein
MGWMGARGQEDPTSPRIGDKWKRFMEEKSMRSEEGKGDTITLFNLTDRHFDSMVRPFVNWAIVESVGEDYAVSSYPITIKVKDGVTVGKFREALMELLLSLNEPDPSRELRDPDVQIESAGINFFSIKAPRNKVLG